MKKIALYGSGNKSLVVNKIIKNYLPDVECRYMIEGKQLQKIGTKLDDLEVISLDGCKKLYEDGKITGVAFPTSYHVFDWNEIKERCIRIGIPVESIYAVPIDVLKKDVLDNGDIKRILTPIEELLQLFHMDIHVTDTCNIGCKGCAHFSNLVKEDTNISAEEIRKTLTELKKLIPNICSIAILGGEPLLNPDLKKIIEIVISTYPYAHTGIVTNGILLMQMKEELIETLQKNHIAINISLYPMFSHNAEKWLEFGKEKGLELHIHECKDFERRLTDRPIFDGNETTKLCGHVLCLSKNYITRCPMLAFVHYYNRKFGDKYPDDGRIYIDQIKSGKELINRLDQKAGLCDYCCGRDQCYEEWSYASYATAKPEDWLMKLPIS